jgi:hypothetical protein
MSNVKVTAEGMAALLHVARGRNTVDRWCDIAIEWMRQADAALSAHDNNANVSVQANLASTLNAHAGPICGPWPTLAAALDALEPDAEDEFGRGMIFAPRRHVVERTADQPDAARVEDRRLHILLSRIAVDCQAGLYDVSQLMSNPPMNPCAYHVLRLLRDAGYQARAADQQSVCHHAWSSYDPLYVHCTRCGIAYDKATADKT